MAKTIGKFGFALLLALLAGAARDRAPVATRPAQAGGAQTQPAYAREVFDLGSADFDLRQAATRRLWRAGVLAEPALKVAAGSDNPETAGRARALLQYIEEGIVPSTPPAIIRLLDAYQLSANPEQRTSLIGQLRDSGTDGVRILLRLRAHADSRDRRQIQLFLRQSPRTAVALLLGEHDRAGAEALLDPNADSDDTVAYWLVGGQVRDRIEAYRREDDATLLCRLEWADGNAAAALHDARASGDVLLVHRVLILQADWPGLASQLQAEPAQQSMLLEGARAMIDRYAGDNAGADKIIAALRPPNNPRPNQHDDGGLGAALCINDRPVEAVEAWRDAGMGYQASEGYQAQLRYKELIGQLDHFDPADVDTVRMAAQGASVLDFLGLHEQARKMLRQASDANAQLHDFVTIGMLCQSAAQMKQTTDVDAYILDGVRDGTEPDWLFEMAGIADAPDAAWWWRALRDRQDPAEALRQVQAIAGHHPSKTDAAKLAKSVEEWSQTQPTESQPAIVHAIAAAMKLAGDPPERAIARIREHAEAFPSVQMDQALGDALADQHDWPAAAAAYGDAVELDPADPRSALLHGWAMTQAGDTDAGKSQIELAHLLPLGDMQLRLDLFTTAQSHGLAADADLERKLMLALGDPGSSAMVELLRISSDNAQTKKDYAQALRYARQTLVAATLGSVSYGDQLAYLELAADVHRLAAMSALAAHKPDSALAEAAIYYKDNPADVDGLISLVRLADASAEPKTADALFKLGYTTYSQLCQTYPASGPLQNQLAWSESRCRRDLPDALIHAKKAVELDPNNTASMDTLAETYYQLHQFQHAIATIQKCIQLEPDEPHHRKQLARFQLALKTGNADNQ